MTDTIYHDEKITLFTGSLAEKNKVKIIAEFEIESDLSMIDSCLEELYSTLDGELPKSHHYVTKNNIDIYIMDLKSGQDAVHSKVMLIHDEECDTIERLKGVAKDVAACYRKLVGKIGSDIDKKHMVDSSQDVAASIESINQRPSNWRYPHTEAGIYGRLPSALFEELCD